MSNINKFLNKTVVISGLVVMGLITIPMTASAQNRGKNNNRVIVNNNNNVVVNNRGNRGKLSLNRGMGGRQIGYNNRNRNGYRRNVRGNNRAYNRGFRQGRRNNGGAFVGGLFTGAIISSAFNRRNYNTNVGINYGYGHPGFGYGYPGYRFAPRTNVVYVERPVQTVVQQVPVYAQGPNYQQQAQYQQQSQYQYQPTQQQAVNNSCLQSREYTTTIEIGGEAVPAYGQACLQPDGSWKFGDPVAVPSF